MTGLEALKDFYIFFKQCEIENKYNKQLTNHFLGLHNIIEKELKALEFLKSGHWIIEEDFSKASCFVFGKFSKEKYELLKETLKNE